VGDREGSEAMSVRKCACKRGPVVARAWDDSCYGWRRICAQCRREKLVAFACGIREALARGAEPAARVHLHSFVALADLPTKLTSAKVGRIYGLAVNCGQVTFKVERHHEQRWGAIQTWTIDPKTARAEVRESEPRAAVRTEAIAGRACDA
jgi:hypothetical protein